VRAGDADPGSLERRRREIALQAYITIMVHIVLDGYPTLTLRLSDNSASVFLRKSGIT
jgi:hypothetical protein